MRLISLSILLIETIMSPSRDSTGARQGRRKGAHLPKSKASRAARPAAKSSRSISPTAALASLAYAPAEVMAVLRHFLKRYGKRLWREFGFVDAFCESQNWYADTFLGIDQGPIIVTIENHRTGLFWKLFMAVSEVPAGLRWLGFVSPHLKPRRR